MTLYLVYYNKMTITRNQIIVFQENLLSVDAFSHNAPIYTLYISPELIQSNTRARMFWQP